MAVSMRLKRLGSNKKPFYRIIVIDKRRAPSGREIDNIGIYNPLPAEVRLEINEEKALNWLRKGAIVTSTVKRLLSKKGILKSFHLEKTSKKSGNQEV